MRIFKKKAKRGFTLVELVVVIAVIAILAAVSVGAYFGITDSANNSKLEQEAKMVHTNLQLVLSANNSNHYMTRDGAYIGDTTIFEGKFNEMTGGAVSYDFKYGSEPTSISKDTIYFIQPSVSPPPGSLTPYTHFGYYSNSIADKRAVVDIVSGKVDVEKTTVEVGGGGSSGTVPGGEEPGHSHSYTSTVVNPTCTEKGYTLNVCECGDETITDETEVNPEAHSWGEGVVTTDPTCNETGIMTYKCIHDNSHERTETIAINEEKHDWDEGEVTTEPTCTTTGVRTYTCKHNEEHKRTETIAINKDAHSWDAGEITTNSTCSTHGVKTYTCIHNNSHKYTEDLEFNASEHVWDEGEVTTQPTCTTPGVRTYRCTRNSLHTKTEPIAVNPDAHKYDNGKVTTEPTCIKPGTKTYTCEYNEEHTRTEDVAIEENHDWDGGSITTEATCSTEGVITYECKHDSSHTYTEIIGIKEGAHARNEGVVTEEATCKKTGIKTYTCEHNSKHTYTEEIPVNPENHSYSSTIVPPTCGKGGYTQHTCSWCGDTNKTDSTDATGEHSYVDHVCSGCGQPEPIVAKAGYYILGTFNNWDIAYNKDYAKYQLTENTGNTKEIKLENFSVAKNDEFKFAYFNGSALSYYAAEEANDNNEIDIVGDDRNYKAKADLKFSAYVTIESGNYNRNIGATWFSGIAANGYYIIGDFNDWNIRFNTKASTYLLEEYDSTTEVRKLGFSLTKDQQFKFIKIEGDSVTWIDVRNVEGATSYVGKVTDSNGTLNYKALSSCKLNMYVTVKSGTHSVGRTWFATA